MRVRGLLRRLLPALLLLLLPAAAAAPPGFVTTAGESFVLDGQPFHMAGSNAYYLPFLDNTTDVARGLRAARGAGLTSMRTWGFNERNATTVAGGLPGYGGEGAGPTDVVFQTWAAGRATVNESALRVFDGVVAAAEAAGVRLVVALTNNWADYGGMDVYTVNLGGKYHDDFYTSPRIIAAFKSYVRTFVARYASSPAIFAWELVNEPRCAGDAVRNLPSSGNCTPATLTRWIADLSAFIKSVDPAHMVTTGSEGAFAIAGANDSFYNGADGDDFSAQLALPHISYNTFHVYPDWWTKDPLTWAVQWVRDHAAAQRAARKPVVMEEYGWLTPAARLANLGTVSNLTRLEVVGRWQDVAVQERLAGDSYWQFGWCGWSSGCNNDDGFTIYLNDSDARELVYQHARVVDEER